MTIWQPLQICPNRKHILGLLQQRFQSFFFFLASRLRLAGAHQQLDDFATWTKTRLLGGGR
jgi:hypothetical protein